MADYRIKRGKNGFTILKDGKVWAVAIPTRILAQQAVEEEQKHEALIRIATDSERVSETDFLEPAILNGFRENLVRDFRRDHVTCGPSLARF